MGTGGGKPDFRRCKLGKMGPLTEPAHRAEGKASPPPKKKLAGSGTFENEKELETGI